MSGIDTVVTSPYLTTVEVAARYRTSPSTVRYWASTGKGPRSARFGKQRLYVLEDLIVWERKLYSAEGQS